jgi:hypothetical protein
MFAQSIQSVKMTGLSSMKMFPSILVFVFTSFISNVGLSSSDSISDSDSDFNESDRQKAIRTNHLNFHDITFTFLEEKYLRRLQRHIETYAPLFTEEEINQLKHHFLPAMGELVNRQFLLRPNNERLWPYLQKIPADYKILLMLSQTQDAKTKKLLLIQIIETHQKKFRYTGQTYTPYQAQNEALQIIMQESIDFEKRYRERLHTLRHEADVILPARQTVADFQAFITNYGSLIKKLEKERRHFLLGWEQAERLALRKQFSTTRKQLPDLLERYNHVYETITPTPSSEMPSVFLHSMKQKDTKSTCTPHAQSTPCVEKERKPSEQSPQQPSRPLFKSDPVKVPVLPLEKLALLNEVSSEKGSPEKRKRSPPVPAHTSSSARDTAKSPKLKRTRSTNAAYIKGTRPPSPLCNAHALFSKIKASADKLTPRKLSPKKSPKKDHQH